MGQTVKMEVLVLVSLLAAAFLCYAQAASQCPQTEFKCSNGKCIHGNWVCHGANWCGDNSAEKVCDLYNCHPLSFQCLNGKCISGRNFCHNGDHCGDNSDELYCNIDSSVPCPDGWIRCPSGSRCIPANWVCNGLLDCEGESEERNCDLYNCHPLSFQCLNGNCISGGYFCNNGYQCGDNSDERYCNIGSSEPCPAGWIRCPSGSRCIPAKWLCNGVQNCKGESEEKNCDTVTSPTTTSLTSPTTTTRTSSTTITLTSPTTTTLTSPTNTTLTSPTSSTITPSTTTAFKSPEYNVAKAELKSWLLRRRKPGSRTDRWGSQVPRIAVALHLADNSTFALGNSTGKEIRYELTTQLLQRLRKDKKMSSQELALYIHALLVSCMDPRDFYGDDLVRELRKRVEVARNYTNPFLVLALCNAGDAMTDRDLERVTAAHDSQYRPFWTDYQALASMALSCISSHSKVSVDERILKDMLQELKKRQFSNGTVDNFRTTALVTQALFIHDSYKKDFYLDSAIKVLTDGFNGRKSLLDVYYALPVLSQKSLLNVTSGHCSKQPVAEDDALQKALDVTGETMTVLYSVWMGDKINVGRTWRLRMRVNSTIYDAIETVAKIDRRQKVEYNVVDGKPYVAALNGKEDDPEMGMFWFVYLKTLSSDRDPEVGEESPVDIKLQPNQEIILWYKRGPWSG